MKVRDYLQELEKSKEGKPGQVRDGIDSFIELWRGALGRGVVSEDDQVSDALAKIDSVGGLYKAAEGVTS